MRSSVTTSSEKSTRFQSSNGFSITMRTVPTSQSSQKLTFRSWRMMSALPNRAGQPSGTAWAHVGSAHGTKPASTSSRMAILLPSFVVLF